MSSSPRDPQTRLPLSASLSQHDQRPASSLVARQLSAVLLASDTFPVDKDCALVDATAGAVVVTLPAGSADVVGLPFLAYKTDSSANAVSLARAGTDEFADASTSISTTTEGSSIGALWDGLVWRPLSAAATAGPVAATTLDATTTVTVGGTGAGTAAASLVLNKTAAGTAIEAFKVANTLRGELLMDGSENFILRNYAADGTTVLGSLTFNNASGLLTSLLGMVITAGGLTVTAGGASIVAGNLALTAGVRLVANLPDAVDDAAAAALSPTVPVGGLYRTAGVVNQRLV